MNDAVRKLLVGLIVVSTLAFGIAVALERSNGDVDSEGASRTEEPGGEETHTDEGAEPVSSGSTASATDEGTILGVDPEATPFVILVVVASLALAGAIRFRPGWRWLLLVAAIGMLVFAVLDVREAVHQFDEGAPGLGIAASVIAVLHALAGAIALLLRRSNAGAVSAQT